MKDLLFLGSDLWLMATCWYFGIRLLRTYGNHLLALEWLVVAVSSTNFLLWALTGGDEGSPLYNLAYILDAFSRSFGITLILVLGLMRATHGYKPPPWVEIGAFALAAVSGALLGGLHDDDLHVGLASFYVATNLLTAVFLAYFAKRLWDAGATRHAIATALVTAAATYVAVVYDFFPFSFDDEDRTSFYTLALTVWGTQAVVYFFAYRALLEKNEVAASARTERRSVLA
jgi:hypothetical protein